MESTTTSFPPGSRTSMSGRSCPSPVWIVDCSTKSQWETIPAISTTLRSWISPHEPRVEGRFSAETRLPVSLRSVSVPCVNVRTISASWTCESRRSRSRRESSLSTLPSFSWTGSTSRLISAVRARHLARGALLLGAALVGEALRQRIAGLLEHVSRDRLQFVARRARGWV